MNFTMAIMTMTRKATLRFDDFSMAVHQTFFKPLVGSFMHNSHIISCEDFWTIFFVNFPTTFWLETLFFVFPKKGGL